MKKLMLMVVSLAGGIICGCRSVPLTPDECWARYGFYYKPTGIAAEAPKSSPVLEIVESSQLDAYDKRYAADGMSILGTMTIDDGNDINSDRVRALAQKLNAGAVVWSARSSDNRARALPNADMGIPGVDYIQGRDMTATRPDEGLAEFTSRCHVIRFYGSAKK